MVNLGPLDTILLGNTVLAWIIALALLCLTPIALKIGVTAIQRRLQIVAERRASRVARYAAEILNRIKLTTLIAAALAVALTFVVLPANIDQFFGAVIAAGLIAQGALLAIAVSSFAIRGWFEADGLEPGELTVIDTLTFLASVVIWALAGLVLLDNLGVDVTALLAGLGVGGIAVALAVQNILGDLFASLSIVLDKPFVVGDFIVVGSEMGTVEKVGLKTTRIRSLSGEQLVFANGDLLGSRVRNFKRMNERRVVLQIGVTYQTSRGALEQIPQLIKDAICSETAVRFDRSHFFKFGASSLDFEAVYIVLSSDYNVYMDIQQRILLRIFDLFTAKKIEFAYPTQTLFVSHAPLAANA